MADRLELRPLNDTRAMVDDLPGFSPRVVDQAWLDALEVGLTPAPETIAGLAEGSAALMRRLEAGTLVPRSRVTFGEIDLDSPLEVHNYTGRCPTLTYEVNPVTGCHVGCQYCLVTDGAHEQEITVWSNYPEYVAQALEEHHRQRHFFYFSPKTEALQEPTLQTGQAHDLLRVFIAHYERHPDSMARLFFASKGGIRQLSVTHGGESVLDLFARLSPWMQFNTSLSIMPEELRRLLEPNAPPITERLEAVRACQARGIMANSALVQPILTPWLEEARLDAFFGALATAGIINFKPELLTVSPACLAIIGQIAGHLDRGLERDLYAAYLAPDNRDHKKQRDRTAPEKARSIAAIRQLMATAERHGIATSVCYWVRAALGISEETIPIINRHGFQCLGYQTRLFEPGGAR
ncbi:MAG: radical SAM protein [Pseudomonadota bacterium]